MEKRDLLKDQIEQLGKVLARILSDLVGLKSNGQISQGIDLANEQLQTELDIEMESLLTLKTKDLKDYLQTRLFNAGHLAILSEYLVEIGKTEMERNTESAVVKFEKAIELLAIADEISRAVSFDRINKKNEIENLMRKYK